MVLCKLDDTPRVAAGFEGQKHLKKIRNNLKQLIYHTLKIKQFYEINKFMIDENKSKLCALR
jgi:hypothetical protein